MSSRPSLSKSNNATPPLIDSTMYFFSGAAWCWKVMPASGVTSRKRVAAGGCDADTTTDTASDMTHRTPGTRFTLPTTSQHLQFVLESAELLLIDREVFLCVRVV